MNRDGSNVRRLTNHPGDDITPTWSPSGTQIAFTSRPQRRRRRSTSWAPTASACSRSPRESYADRPTWSPAPFNEIAYAARTGPGNDIKVLDLATRQVRQLTFGEGTNESPAFAPNGRHLAFIVDAVGQGADLHDRPRRQGPPADHANRQQLPAGLVQVSRIAEHWTRRRRWSTDDDDGGLTKRRLILALLRRRWRRPAAARSRRWPGRFRPRPRRRTPTAASRPPAPPEPVAEPTVVPPEPVRDDRISSASLDDLNRNSPLKPVFFELRQQRARRPTARRRSTRTPAC